MNYYIRGLNLAIAVIRSVSGRDSIRAAKPGGSGIAPALGWHDADCGPLQARGETLFARRMLGARFAFALRGEAASGISSATANFACLAIGWTRASEGPKANELIRKGLKGPSGGLQPPTGGAFEPLLGLATTLGPLLSSTCTLAVRLLYGKRARPASGRDGRPAFGSLTCF